MSTQLNESGDVHTLQPRELNTHSKSITIDFPISERFYRFYPALLWQPTAELPLATLAGVGAAIHTDTQCQGS